MYTNKRKKEKKKKEKCSQTTLNSAASTPGPPDLHTDLTPVLRRCPRFTPHWEVAYLQDFVPRWTMLHTPRLHSTPH